jgi:BACON domain-containing protein
MMKQCKAAGARRAGPRPTFPLGLCTASLIVLVVLSACGLFGSADSEAVATPTLGIFQITARPLSPTVPPAPAQLSVSPGGPVSVSCNQSPVATVTVRNSGGGSLNWAASASAGANVTATPSSGTLNGGQEQTVTFEGKPTQSAFSITFTSNGGSRTVQVTCK